MMENYYRRGSPVAGIANGEDYRQGESAGTEVAHGLPADGVGDELDEAVEEAEEEGGAEGEHDGSEHRREVGTQREGQVAQVQPQVSPSLEQPLVRFCLQALFINISFVQLRIKKRKI